MAWLRADDSRGQPSIHSVKYRKLDHTIDYKSRVSKSFRHLPGASKFKGDLKGAHALFFVSLDKPGGSSYHT